MWSVPYKEATNGLVSCWYDGGLNGNRTQDRNKGQERKELVTTLESEGNVHRPLSGSSLKVPHLPPLGP